MSRGIGPDGKYYGEGGASDSEDIDDDDSDNYSDDEEWVPPPGATEADAKRMKASFDKMADEYVCPITLQFPFHPVIAQDGRIYERDAIEQWWGKDAEGPAFHARTVKSPVTNEAIGTKLIAAPQVRNAIELGIEGGMFIGDRAKAWLAKKEAAEADARARRRLRRS